ncbi:glycosyltransferase family 39 protein, partial [Acidithiobacillus ferridurans]|nr:glycosyltransferase family 39 protein [Acidithiobacillus ferridurans]
KPSREMGQRIAALQGPQPYRLASWQWFQPSFLFYAGRGNMPIRHLQTLTELPALLGPEPLYLVCPEHAVAAVRAAVPAAYRQQTVLLRYEIYNHENIALLRISPRTKSLDHAIAPYYHQ